MKKSYSGHLVNGVPEVRVHENGNNLVLDPGAAQRILDELFRSLDTPLPCRTPAGVNAVGPTSRRGVSTNAVPSTPRGSGIAGGAEPSCETKASNATCPSVPDAAKQHGGQSNEQNGDGLESSSAGSVSDAGTRDAKPRSTSTIVTAGISTNSEGASVSEKSNSTPNASNSSALTATSKNTSVEPFAWGNSGRGSTLLACAILLDFTGDRHIAEALYQDFKWAFVAYWSKDSWTLRGEDLQEWLKTYESKHLGAS